MGFQATNAALILSDSDFDQIDKIVDLGGSVTQIGGSEPGRNLLSAADFLGQADTQSGVLITLGSFIYAQAEEAFSGGSSIEPGNVPQLMLNVPTDITFTAPGAGGPDGTAGDGSVQMKVPGAFVTLKFGTAIIAPPNITHDLFVFTDTAGGGTATFEVLDVFNNVIETLGPITAPAGTLGSGQGGLLFDVTDGVTYAGVRVTVNTTTAEVDAVAAFIPEPAVLPLVAPALILLASRRFRR